MYGRLGDMFPGQEQEAFAVSTIVKNVAYTATFVYSSLLCVYVKLIIAMVLLAFSLVMYCYVEIKFQRRRRVQKRSDPRNMKEKVELETE